MSATYVFDGHCHLADQQLWKFWSRPLVAGMRHLAAVQGVDIICTA